MNLKHDVKVIDAIVLQMTEEECTQLILKIKLNYIIFVTGFLSKDEDFAYIRQIIQYLECTIIVTGEYLLYDAEKIMIQNRFIDAVLVNYTSKVILNYIDGDENLFDICVRKNEKIIMYPASDAKIVSYGPPIYSLFPVEKYKSPYSTQIYMSISTDIGCPYQCNFCIAREIPYKTRELENVKEELLAAQKYGITEFFFRDFTFGVDKDKTIKLCNILKKLNITWVVSSRADLLDDAMLRLMKEAGCHTLNVGVETASNSNLHKIKKYITIERINEVFNICNKLGIKTLAHYTIGLPGETKSDILNTIKFSRKLPSDFASYNIAIPLSGTDIEKNRYQDGLSQYELKRLCNKAYWDFYFNIPYIWRRIKQIRNWHIFKADLLNGIKLIERIIR